MTVLSAFPKEKLIETCCLVWKSLYLGCMWDVGDAGLGGVVGGWVAS